ncbi:glyoxylate/hydroxypyruvate reductase A [Marinospirillum celere]|uniref:Glyoxylate/hydroxypyruvate reductase A n=1 Tax=Marinospirillum celere TaxID=1122252 RepID=A0A1I1JWQ1_9GAMM|nr:glyoxylate/hydroxypyruvate reductase A [Marinospirillum celere]SFC52412.1 glyoxylate/hydroxypyruvate reductase A [Marinospirillum celere]
MLYLHIEPDQQLWLDYFAQEYPDLQVVTADDDYDASQIRWVAAWSPPKDLFAKFTNLEAVFALGAGVDAFVRRDDLSPEVPLVRLLDAGMADQMVEYILWATLTVQRDFDTYLEQQRQNRWQEHTARMRHQMRLGILGLGALGQQVAKTLASYGYPVSGWKRSAIELDGVDVFTGDEGLKQLVSQSDVLISLLPNTPQTQGLLNGELLSRLPKGASLVNVARGVQVVDEDLLDLLESGHLRFAALDVFHEEPLPADHPYWQHPKVFVTPHMAAATLPEPAVKQVVASLKKFEAGGEPEGLVRPESGY